MDNVKEILHREGISTITYSFTQERALIYILEEVEHKLVPFNSLEEYERLIKLEVLEGNKHFTLDLMEIRSTFYSNIGNTFGMIDAAKMIGKVVSHLLELSHNMGLSFLLTTPFQKTSGENISTSVGSLSVMHASNFTMKLEEFREDKTLIVDILKSRHGSQGKYNIASSFPGVFRKIKLNKLEL